MDTFVSVAFFYVHNIMAYKKGIYMTKKEFYTRIQEQITECLGPEYTVTLKRVTKNNGVILQGLLIGQDRQNVTPTIYLEAFWDSYRQGETMEHIVKRILDLYRRSIPASFPDMEFYRDFPRVKDRIIYKLVNAERNCKLLDTVPHIDFLDLAICFCYAFSHQSIGDGTILVTNDQMKAWKTNTVELLRLAQKNTVRLFGTDFKPMEDLLTQLLQDEIREGEVEGDALFAMPLPMKVLSNRRHQLGAAAMIYPGTLQEIAGQFGADLYILPSSVHEVVIVPADAGESPEFLREMVQEVNATQVLPEELLSDHLYYYDREKREVTIAI